MFAFVAESSSGLVARWVTRINVYRVILLLATVISWRKRGKTRTNLASERAVDGDVGGQTESVDTHVSVLLSRCKGN